MDGRTVSWNLRIGQRMYGWRCLCDSQIRLLQHGHSWLDSLRRVISWSSMGVAFINGMCPWITLLSLARYTTFTDPIFDRVSLIDNAAGQYCRNALQPGHLPRQTIHLAPTQTTLRRSQNGKNTHRHPRAHLGELLVLLPIPWSHGVPMRTESQDLGSFHHDGGLY